MAKVSEYYETIGLLAVEVEKLHDELRMFTGTLISNDSALNTHILAGVNSSQLLRLFKSLFLYRIKDREIRSRFLRGTWRSLSELFDARNTYIHSVWSIREDRDGNAIATRAKYSRPNLSSLKLDRKHDELPTMTDLIGGVGRMRSDLVTMRIDTLRDMIEQHKGATKRVNTTAWVNGHYYPPGPPKVQKKTPKKDSN